MKREDFEATDPCDCPECQQAGIAGATPIRDRSGVWLHGYPLKRAIEAKEEFWREFRAKFGPGKKAMR